MPDLKDFDRMKLRSLLADEKTWFGIATTFGGLIVWAVYVAERSV